MSENTPLSSKLLSSTNRPLLIADAHRVLDVEVSKKRGLGGLALKGAYKTVSAIKPSFIEGVIGALLDEWIRAYDEEYAAWDVQGRPGTFGSFLVSRKTDVAERMLEVTDRRAKASPHQTAAALYWKMRGGAKSHVVDALPAVAEIVDRHLGDT
jgi:hypothetical protein